MAKRYCICGKSITARKDGTPRAHVCTGAVPVWAEDVVPGQPVVPADVDETECTHPGGFTWADDGNGHEGSVCRVCGAEEPDSPTEEPRPPTSALGIAMAANEANWNGTGRPRPSASNVAMPPAEPVTEQPRSLDWLSAASAGAGTVLDAMTPVQQMEAASIGMQQMARSMGGPAELIEAAHPGTAKYVETYGRSGAPDAVNAFLAPFQTGIGYIRTESPVRLVRYSSTPCCSSTSALKACGSLSRPLSSIRAE